MSSQRLFSLIPMQYFILIRRQCSLDFFLSRLCSLWTRALTGCTFCSRKRYFQCIRASRNRIMINQYYRWFSQFYRHRKSVEQVLNYFSLANVMHFDKCHISNLDCCRLKSETELVIISKQSFTKTWVNNQKKPSGNMVQTIGTKYKDENIYSKISKNLKDQVFGR